MLDKKKLVIMFLLVAVLFSAFLFIKTITKPYSVNPKDWINKHDNKIEIDLNEATMTASVQNYLGQQYNNGQIQTVFVHDGMYNGHYFKDEYIENNEVKIRFSKNIVPNNGVPEIYVMERIINDKPMIYIFVDNDWKSQIKDTNILWGAQFQNFKEFEFSKLGDGIYLDYVEDDAARFKNNFKIHRGGVIIGQITAIDDAADKISIRFS